jgi:hypothetical protein
MSFATMKKHLEGFRRVHTQYQTALFSPPKKAPVKKGKRIS